MIETWLMAPGHPQHIMSSLGRVRHTRENAPILKGYFDADGYRRVRLDGRERRVHRLVCEAFHGPPPIGTECAHIDGQPGNNAATNLRWATPKENSADKAEQGRFNGGTIPGSGRLSDNDVAALREAYASGLSQRTLARKFGISQSYCCRVLTGKRREASPERTSHAE